MHVIPSRLPVVSAAVPCFEQLLLLDDVLQHVLGLPKLLSVDQLHGGLSLHASAEESGAQIGANAGQRAQRDLQLLQEQIRECY